MDKNVIEGSVSRASVPSDAKPISGSRHRVNDAFAWRKSTPLSGEASWSGGDGLDVPYSRRSRSSNVAVGHEESAEGIVASRNEPGVVADGIPVRRRLQEVSL